ncbi:COP23 domain-containing protein [Cyanobacterium sp. Dongsha4]|uniref:COP23 domain-containing protein n=1 Tax=Cyanobacterium sp. DS4 TaxID=2878255 RepID=UPI002E80CB75|nr:COP23 domain-containing protein [Cyanobacterium sp. Dongsha4]WVK99869.1 COP23 domain-containing protein [Cyanobacterium sp. Dongsha4]
MKPRFALVFSFILSLIFGQILSLIFINSAQADSKKNVYSCIEHEGKPITVVDTTRGRIQLIVWQSDYFRASGWTPEKRCQEVSKRFQRFSDNDTLRFIANGTINKYKVICVSPKSSDIVCQEQNLLMTLEPKDNPVEVMRQLFEDAVKIGAMPIRRSQAVLDLDKYFAVAPLMDAISPIQKPPLIPEEKKPPQKPSQSGTTIECPPILCD